ncbi:hypothetical protein [Asticcacaulis sp. W401b]|uniref:hypothetical protein n=1 Tax=Asticcacaulis sp. W401b TaxID=3388666 RepID=UPI003970DD63
MSDSNEPKLTPEAVKMLNDLAANRSTGGLNLTPEAQSNLEKFANEHLTHTYKDHKTSYLIMAIVLGLLGSFAFLYMADGMFDSPEAFAKTMNAMIIVVPVCALAFFGSYRFWSAYRRL